jgi:isoquinoline 1-oxidoreductase alpha subunit
VAVKFVLNNQEVDLDVEPDMPLLWAIRDIAGLTGTKYACGKALCGATIEGLSEDGSHPVQVAWRELNVAQCGYCQSGQIMSAAALLERVPKPGDEDIDAAMSGNICRCGTYTRIRKAIHKAAEGQS